MSAQTDSLGRATTYSYDANARLAKTDYPDGSSEQTGYDAEGNETSKTDRQGRLTRMEYDALNRLSRTTYPDGTSQSTEYDAAGRVVASTDRAGKRATMEYDAAGRQTASVDATGRRTETTFDPNGNRTAVKVAAGTPQARTTSYEYDALNRLTKTTWPDGSVHASVYRPDNRKESETDQRGMTTAYGYDAAGRLVSVRQSLSATATATTSYGYDATGAKVSQVDALGRTTTWTLDGNGRVTARQIQDGSKETSSYDQEGSRLAKTTFAGEQLTFQYDSSNRLTGQIVPAGTGPNAGIPGVSIVSSYSQNGQLVSQQEQGANTLNGTQSWQYDTNDRLIATTNPPGRIGWALDGEGRITERSMQAGSVNAGTARMEYDEAGRLKKLTAPDSKLATYGYDQSGRLITTDRELNQVNGQSQSIVTHQRYDSADRTTAIAHVKRIGSSETLVAAQALTRGAGGAIQRIDTFREGNGISFDAVAGTITGTPTTSVGYEYDGNGRLTREAKGTEDVRYEYDAAGNRTRKTVASSAATITTTYAYDSADRLKTETLVTSAGSTATAYGWDTNGNLSSKVEPGKVTLYRFDPQNRLIDIRTGTTLAEAQAATPSVSYAYAASGIRIRKQAKSGSSTVPERVSSYLIDSNQSYALVAVESTTQGTSTGSTGYLWGNGLMRQTKLNGQSTDDLFPLAGHLNTSLGAVDANGNLAEQTNSDAFGNLEQVAGAKQAHLYTGEYWDQDSQLVYLRARWYDPKIGQFVSPDAIAGKRQDPRSLNRYSYAHADVIHKTDPLGLFADLNGTFTGLAGSNIVGNASVSAGAALGATALRRIAIRLLVAGVAITPSQLNTIEKTCTSNPNEPSCAADVPAIFYGVQHSNHAAFVRQTYESIRSFGPLTYSRKNENSFKNRQWYKGASECAGKTGMTSGLDCDEFPYFMHQEGGPDNYDLGMVGLSPMPSGENRSAGATWNVFLGKCGVTPDSGERSRHLVVPLPVGATVATFWTGRTCQ